MNKKLALFVAIVMAAGFFHGKVDGGIRVPGALPSLVFVDEDDRKPLPEGVLGFSGQVNGQVVEKGEKGEKVFFYFKVLRVLRVWEGNKAKNPEALVGHTVCVEPQWTQNQQGKWHLIDSHVAFIKKLEQGEKLTLEIRNSERHLFEILELSGEQRKRAGEGKPEYTPLPEGIQGFKGYLIGSLKSVDEKGAVFKVMNIEGRKGNRAKNPICISGEKINVLFICFMGEDKKYHVYEELRDAIRDLHEKGSVVTVRVWVERDEAIIMDRVWKGAQIDPERPDPPAPMIK